MKTTLLITLLFSASVIAQTRPDMTSNPSSGFGTVTTPTETSPTRFPTNELPQNNNSNTQENRGNAFPQQMEERNNFAGGALGGASPRSTIPATPGATPGSTAPGVAPTTPKLPTTGVGRGKGTP